MLSLISRFGLISFLLLHCLFHLLFPTFARCAIVYAGGTNVNTTCVGVTGTKQELASCIQDALNSAGWTTISGSHSADILVESLTTPASLQMRLELLTSATNCVTLRGRNVANTKAAAVGQFLLPGIAKTFRIVADKYQYFISTDGTPGARSAAGGGVLYVPSFTGITEAIWTAGNATNDTDTGVEPFYKNCLGLSAGNGVCVAGISPSYWTTVNGTQFESVGGIGSTAYGTPTLIVPWSATTFGGSVGSFYRWFDNSAFISEPLFAFCTTGTTCEAKIIGQWWDAAFVTDGMASETALTFDSRNWLALTNNNNGIASSQARGTIILVVP